MPTAAPRRTICGGCGGGFSIGWGILNHQQTRPCTPNSSQTEDNAAVSEGLIIPGTPATVNEYTESLARRGTLDPLFLNHYAKWGPKPVGRVVQESCKFLRSAEVGTGLSRRHAQTFLDYAKSLGGRSHLLPRTVEGCWSVVEKVTFHNVNVTFHCRIVTFHNVNVAFHCRIVTFHNVNSPPLNIACTTTVGKCHISLSDCDISQRQCHISLPGCDISQR